MPLTPVVPVVQSLHVYPCYYNLSISNLPSLPQLNECFIPFEYIRLPSQANAFHDSVDGLALTGYSAVSLVNWQIDIAPNERMCDL